MDNSQTDQFEPEQRLTPRDAEHLQTFPVEILQGASRFSGVLVNESITGVAVELEGEADFETDTCVVVQNGRNSRDAIVSRIWIGPEGGMCLGLTWRAAQFR